MGRDAFEHVTDWCGSPDASFRQFQAQIIELVVELGGDLEALRDDDPELADFIETIHGIAVTPGPNVSAPLEPEALVRVFGTPTPTEDDLDAHGDALSEVLEAKAVRGHGYHLVLYDEGEPRQIVFFGWTED